MPDITGQSPSGPVPVTPLEYKTYTELNNFTFNTSQIVTATGASRLLSLKVEQLAGTAGTVQGDTGSSVPLSAGQSVSWSVTDDDTAQTLSTSTFAMSAGAGGQQRITATYID